MAQITFPKTGLSLDQIKISPDVDQMKKEYFAASPEVDVERPRLLTEYFKANGLFNKSQITSLDAAKAYRYVLQNRTPIVRHAFGYKKVKGQKGMVRMDLHDKSPFAGSTTSKSKGVILYPEWLALTLWPELETMENRAANPFQLSAADADTLNKDVFPNWINFNIMDLTRAKIYGNGEKTSPLLQLHDYLVFFLVSKFQCISHTIPDFKKALGMGLQGIINEAKTKQTEAGDQARKDFYQAMKEGMMGIIEYSAALANKAEQMANSAQGNDKKELQEIARIYRTVPKNPATTFREGLTTIWLCWIACHLENSNTGLSLGRLDQLLYPLYRADVDAGRLTPEEAVELVCHLWLKIGDHVPSIPEAGEQLFGGTGSNQAITLGGVDENGEDAVNDLTYVMLRATELMMLRDPNLNCRYHPEKSSREYLERICEVNVNTRATPAIHNDRAIIDAMMRKGESQAQARDYGVVGCVEPTSAGRGYMATGAILLNLASALEMALFDGRHRHTGSLQIGPHTGDPTRFTSYQQFRDAFEIQARWLIKQAVTLNNIAGEIHQKYHPTPILSTLFEGPLEKGKDLVFAGAERNASGVATIGFADTADCLSVIEQKVYGDKSMSWETLMKALNNNFKGYEALQAELRNPAKTPKYGNENPLADNNASFIAQLLDEEFGKSPHYRGAGIHYRVGYWTMTSHAGYGRLTKALPNGRGDRENFTSGFTPVSGETPELTKTLNSVSSVPSKYLSSGVAFNIKYTPYQSLVEDGDDLDVIREKMIKSFADSVAGYFHGNGNGSKGGVEIQFNVTDEKMFRDAQKNPDKYVDLLVRVSGYTAYFIDLNPQMQSEIIERTEYNLLTGKAVTYSLQA